MGHYLRQSSPPQADTPCRNFGQLDVRPLQAIPARRESVLATLERVIRMKKAAPAGRFPTGRGLERDRAASSSARPPASRGIGISHYFRIFGTSARMALTALSLSLPASKAWL